MSHIKKYAPRRRFEKFSNVDDWEQRKLGDYAEILTGGTPKTSISEYWEPKRIPWMSSGEVNKRRLDGTDNMISEEGLNNSNARWVKEHSVLIALAGQGKTRGTVAVNNIKLTTNQSIAAIVPNDNLHHEFIYQNLIKRYDELRMISSGDGTRGGLNKRIVSDILLLSPSKEEQIKIGTFFKQLDDTFALHQRKLEKIKALKTAYLSEMFPAEGETKPKRRFAGFTDDWEQRKFEDCFKFPVSTNSLSRVMLNYDKGEVKNVHYGDVLIKYPCILNIKKEEIPYITGGRLEAYNSNLLENGDLIFADAAEDETVGKAVEVNGITNENLVSGLHTIVARATTQKAKYFLGYYINSDIYHRQLLRLMQGSKVSAISKGNLQKTDVSFPKDIEEQQKIGSYFKQLDDTITLHQRKLQKLQNIKKAYLNEMFI
ncbi:restriction endonuclease subunit S [Listeria monocytogenes]|nr:restriction endonuclease subunit S [Listeria monocytogenes]